MKKALAMAIAFTALGLGLGALFFGGGPRPPPEPSMPAAIIPGPSANEGGAPIEPLHPATEGMRSVPAVHASPAAPPPPLAEEAAGGALLPEAPLIARADLAVDLSDDGYADRSGRVRAMRAISAAAGEAPPSATDRVLETAAKMVIPPEGEAGAGRLLDDALWRRFIEKMAARHDAARQSSGERAELSAAEVLAIEGMIHRNLGGDVTVLEAALLTGLDELAGVYETAGQPARALSLRLARRDRLWDHPRAYHSASRDVMRAALASDQWDIAFRAAAEQVIRSAEWPEPDFLDIPEPRPFAILSLPRVYGAAATPERRLAMTFAAARMDSLLRLPDPMAALPSLSWQMPLSRLDPALDGPLAMPWPQSLLEEEAWLDSLAEAWRRAAPDSPAPEETRILADEAMPRVPPLRADAPLRRARMLAAAGREREAAAYLSGLESLDGGTTAFLARLVAAIAGDPRAVDPASPRFAAPGWPEEARGALARRLSENGVGARLAAAWREELLADALEAVLGNFHRLTLDAAPGDRARMLPVMLRLAGHPALDRILAGWVGGDWPPTMRTRAETAHRERLESRYAEGIALWGGLRGQMQRREYRDALAALEAIEAKGPRWLGLEWAGGLRAACERRALFADLTEALARGAGDVETALARVRAAYPGMGLRAAFLEAGLLPRRESDLARVERLLDMDKKMAEEAVFASLPAEVGTLPAPARADDLADLREMAEWEWIRAELHIELGRVPEVEASLARLADMAAEAQLTAEYGELAARFARERAWDEWWQGRREAGSAPGSWAELRRAVRGPAPAEAAEAAEAPEGDLLPLIARRAGALAINGQLDESRALWELIFGLSTDEASRRRVAEEIARFDGRPEAAGMGEYRAWLLALALSGETEAAARNQWFARLSAIYAADQPEEAVAALWAWSEASLNPAFRQGVATQTADHWYRQGNFAGALALLEAPWRETDRLLLLRALCRLRLDDEAGAAADLERLIDQFGESPLLDRTLFTLGWIKTFSGEREEAQKWLERVAAEFPDSPYAGQARAFLRRPDAAAGPSGQAPEETPVF